jgi:hypothetical protein
LSILDAAWEIVYRVLCSPEGARLRAISTLEHQCHRTGMAAARIAIQRSRGLTWDKFDVSVSRSAPRSCDVGAVNERVAAMRSLTIALEPLERIVRISDR